MKIPEYIWDEETGTATCRIYYKGLCFEGFAHCHEIDSDMKSRLTGEKIAEFRAMRKYLRHIKAYEIKPRLAALNDYYNSICKNTKFNANSYEMKILRRRIRFLEDDLDTINESIAVVNKNLNEYISSKEKMFKKLRSKRLVKTDKKEASEIQEK